ncbi:alkaline-phosphatase-like protein [Parachaetomium inaequale]|uniref:Arylsulfatase n=1 Tax=Parachaetomium inaequale TaxID=2588326 RepID=A0AAN6PCE8_9PEZI|nr:alkaline-phosphatase-like protein [Parachaetomium inaequale]
MRFSGVILTAGLHLPTVLAGGNDQKPLGLGDSWGPSPQGKRPNIVFVLTDDQDLHMQSLDYLPLIKKNLIDKGTFYKRHYCTTAICCPARVSLWTGKLAHNTNVTDVNPPHGGYPKFVSQGFNNAYLPLWLQQAGYDTYYTGKLFNAHTTDNYHSPYPAGWNGSDFLVDPYTYMYLNASFQRNRDPPVSYAGQHSVDVLAQKALGFLDDAAQSTRPFFLGIAPVAPHSNVNQTSSSNHGDPDKNLDDIDSLVTFTPPIPAARHAHLFPNVTVPRTPHFNPHTAASGANWIRTLPPQSPENVAFNDHFYRQRLRTLQSVDELVDAVVARLDEHGLLENTYVFYTTDNGFHIGQHRLQPGKECGFEEDINIPLIVRGPGVPRGEVAEVVTTHVDLAPTILGIAGVDLEPGRVEEGFGFDGEGIPLTKGELEEAVQTRGEHVTVEFWGFAASEGRLFGEDARRVWANNTYKAVRVIGGEYNFYYAVWCTNEHELYDLKTDPYQLNNLLHASAKRPATLLGVPFEKVIARLDALLFVLKSCKGQTCVRPWHALHPAGNVQNLHNALSSRFDVFYEQQQKKVNYNRCEMGYLPDAEGPQFETDGLVYRQGVRWSEWV